LTENDKQTLLKGQGTFLFVLHDRHNFREVVPSGMSRGHDFREVVPKCVFGGSRRPIKALIWVARLSAPSVSVATLAVDR
jgi:hypothetical protein